MSSGATEDIGGFLAKGEAYQRLRAEQASKILAGQLEAFAVTIRGEQSGPSHGRLAQERIPGPFSTEIFSAVPPFTAGNPNPAQQVYPLPNSQPQLISIQEFGDPLTGQISVGVNGGMITGGGFGGGNNKPFLIPMPDRWLLGDAITSSASLFQVADIPPRILGTGVVASAEFGWQVQQIPNVPVSLDSLGEAIIYQPGSIESSLKGLIGVVLYVEVAVSLIQGAKVLASNVVEENILNLAINAELRGATPDETNNEYLSRVWAFDGDINRTLNLSVTIPLNERADKLVVESRVVLVGLRGGIDDPAAGWVNAAFQNVSKMAPQTGIEPQRACPFIVRRMSAITI